MIFRLFKKVRTTATIVYFAQVHELSQALDGIRTLPTVKEAKIEVELHQKEMEKLKTFYTEQNAKLSEELNELSHQKQSAELEYVTQIEG